MICFNRLQNSHFSHKIVSKPQNPTFLVHKLVSRSNNLKEPYPAPCMTMHFPFICFTSLAAARIASCLTVSNVFFCVTAQPPSFTITSTSHLSAITTDEKAKCEICQAVSFIQTPSSVSCPGFFWGTSHVTIRPDQRI